MYFVHCDACLLHFVVLSYLTFTDYTDYIIVVTSFMITFCQRFIVSISVQITQFLHISFHCSCTINT